MPQENTWTTILVVLVSIATVKIGVNNLEWFLNTTGLIQTKHSCTPYTVALTTEVKFCQKG